jgi:N-acetylglucosaminyl-diphospho-decaprenol L-rhamnosyltransferase
MPSVLTVILNYKTAAMTLRSVDAALREMAGIDGEIVVVDNDSQDGSFETLSAQVPPGVRVIQSGRNGGFGAGNNVGIRAGLADGSRPDYIYVLNSDAFPDPDAIRNLLQTLENTPQAGFAGSYIHGDDGLPHLTTFRFPSIASEFEGAVRFGPISRMLAHRAVPVPIPISTVSVDWLAGASLLMRQSVLDRIGLFDETFFLYFEETDLCRRAQKAGYQVIFVRQSEVTHIGSVSTGMKEWTRVPAYWFDSRWYYFRKNHGTAYALAATMAHLAGGLLHRLRCLLTGKTSADPPHFLRTLVMHDLGLLQKPATRPISAPQNLTGTP